LPDGKYRRIDAVATTDRLTGPAPAGGVAPDSTTAGRHPGGEPRPRRHLVFAVVSIALLMASVDQTIVATALHTIQGDLHARVNWSSWTITIYALGQILVMPLAGSISDQFGRKKVFVAAVVLFTVASLCCGLATNIYELVALRGIQAIGGGAFMPSATGIVADQYGRERDRAIGLFTSIFPIGGIIGPILGGVFVTYWSWRGIFLVNVPLGVVLFFLALAFVPNTATSARARLDWPGIASLGVGLLGVMLAISYLGVGSASALSPLFVGPLLIGLASLVLFVRHSAHAEKPFVPIGLLRGRGFAIVNLINFFFGVAALGFGALVPLYAESRFGISTLDAGTLLTARAVGMIAVAGLAVFALRRTGYRLPMIIGFVLAACGLFLTSLDHHGMSPYVWLAMAAGVTGLGMGISLPASNNAVLQLAPDSTAAIAGLRGMFRQAGGITGISVVTAVVARSADPAVAFAHVFLVMAVLVVALVPLIWLVPDHHGSW
jgi:EmrB/QacA subfamily drug resistance transporter